MNFLRTILRGLLGGIRLAGEALRIIRRPTPLSRPEGTYSTAKRVLDYNSPMVARPYHKWHPYQVYKNYKFSYTNVEYLSDELLKNRGYTRIGTYNYGAGTDGEFWVNHNAKELLIRALPKPPAKPSNVKVHDEEENHFALNEMKNYVNDLSMLRKRLFDSLGALESAKGSPRYASLWLQIFDNFTRLDDLLRFVKNDAANNLKDDILPEDETNFNELVNQLEDFEQAESEFWSRVRELPQPTIYPNRTIQPRNIPFNNHPRPLPRMEFRLNPTFFQPIHRRSFDFLQDRITRRPLLTPSRRTSDSPQPIFRPPPYGNFQHRYGGQGGIDIKQLRPFEQPRVPFWNNRERLLQFQRAPVRNLSNPLSPSASSPFEFKLERRFIISRPEIYRPQIQRIPSIKIPNDRPNPIRTYPGIRDLIS